MTTLITERIEGQHGIYVSATCENVSATVSLHSWGVQVCCHNAANRVWRKSGRNFTNVEDALAGYKSSEMKNIIRAASDSASIVQPSN